MKHIRLVVLVFFLPTLCLAQKNAIPLNISLFNESTAIPFTRFITTPIHPGIQVGTEFNYKKNEHGRLFQSANTSYFYHRYLAQAVGLSTELGYELRTGFGLSFTSLLGLGYTHTFTTSQEFTFSNGKYEKKPDKGNSRFTPSLSLDIGYYLKPKSETSPKVFVRYQSWLEYPYSPGFIPVMTHINLHLGIKFFINNKND